MTSRDLIRSSALAAGIALALAAPVPAQTTNATTDAYGGQQGQVLGNFGGGGNDVVPPPAADKVASAPAGGEAPTARPTTPVERGVDAPVTPAVAKGQLPFTGFESGLVALAGLALLGSGFAMRRVARRDV